VEAPRIAEKNDFFDVEIIRQEVNDYDRFANDATDRPSDAVGKTSENRRIPFDCNEQEKEVMKFLFENESVRSKQVENLLNIKESRTRELLRGMVEKGHIEKHGQGRSTFYTPAKKGRIDEWVEGKR